jgi:hypothetical protein
MTRPAPLSAHEADTLRTILRVGGLVRLSMGRISAVAKDAGTVRTVTVRKLWDRGLVRSWTTAERGHHGAGHLGSQPLRHRGGVPRTRTRPRRAGLRSRR